MLPWQFKRVFVTTSATQEAEAPVDGTEERRGNNQLDKRHKRSAVRGGGATRGSGAGGWEALG
jgi:hypothetical protein